jgi:hypothetical protein
LASEQETWQPLLQQADLQASQQAAHFSQAALQAWQQDAQFLSEQHAWHLVVVHVDLPWQQVSHFEPVQQELHASQQFPASEQHDAWQHVLPFESEQQGAHALQCLASAEQEDAGQQALPSHDLSPQHLDDLAGAWQHPVRSCAQTVVVPSTIARPQTIAHDRSRVIPYAS